MAATAAILGALVTGPPRVLAVLHSRSEPLGLLAEPLAEAGVEADVRLAPEGLPPSLDGYAGLVVMGGTMGVYEADRHPFLRDEQLLIRAALSSARPMLGVCLGSQLLAAAAGARVYRGPSPEVGWAPVRRLADDPWLAGWPEELVPLHLHGDTFELPAGARLLASSAAYPHQAFRVGSGVGVQFHVEATAAMAREWLADPELPESWRITPERLAETERAAPAMVPLARSLGRAFAAAVRAVA
jgi:GMP synthase (glutamine-hydrolysing)